MPDSTSHLQAVGEIVQGLRALGLEPVLVGGMALVLHLVRSGAGH